MERNQIILVAVIVVIAVIVIGLAAMMPGFSKEKTNITVQGGNDTISQGESIDVKLTDVNGTPIDNETVNVTITKVNKTANKTVNKTVKKKTVHTNKKGVAKVKIDEDPGDYIVDCTFSGNDEFEEDTATAEVEVVDYDDTDYGSESQSDDYGDSGAYYSEQEGRTIYTGEIHDAPDGHKYMHLGYNEWEMID